MLLENIYRKIEKNSSAMPELPEVETIRRGLIPQMQGVFVNTLILRREGLRYAFPKNFAKDFCHKPILAIKRRGKYLIFQTNENALIAHLGMSGAFRPLDDGEDFRRHDHVIFALSNGRRIAYHDPRRFGAMDVIAGAGERHPWIAKLGVEPLSNDFHSEYLQSTLKNRQASIKDALLNQEIIAGLGNIYVCEALFLSQIHPQRRAHSVSADELAKLVQAIRNVLNDALASGGSSLRDYTNAEGEMGYFQHHFQVYAKAGEPCPNGCQGEIIRIKQSGRSSFLCPNCQKREV